MPTVDLETCVFCELVAGKRPISVIDEKEDVLAFMDIQPVNPGHVLIIPKHHAPYLGDLDSTLGGLDVGWLKRDMAAREIVRALKANLVLANVLNIYGTPAFIIGGRIVMGRIDLDTLKKMIAAARES